MKVWRWKFARLKKSIIIYNVYKFIIEWIYDNERKNMKTLIWKWTLRVWSQAPDFFLSGSVSKGPKTPGSLRLRLLSPDLTKSILFWISIFFSRPTLEYWWMTQVNPDRLLAAKVYFKILFDEKVYTSYVCLVVLCVYGGRGAVMHFRLSIIILWFCLGSNIHISSSNKFP